MSDQQRFWAIRLNFFLGMLIGGVAGAIADRLTQSTKRDLPLSVLLGIAGAIVGIKIAEALVIPALGQYRDQIAAALGATFVLTGWRQLRQ